MAHPGHMQSRGGPGLPVPLWLRVDLSFRDGEVGGRRDFGGQPWPCQQQSQLQGPGRAASRGARLRCREALPEPASGGQALSPCLAASPQAQSSPGWVPRDPLKPPSKVGWFPGAPLGAQTMPFSALTPGAGWDQVAHPVVGQLCSQPPVSGVCTAPAGVDPAPRRRWSPSLWHFSSTLRGAGFGGGGTGRDGHRVCPG